MYMIYSVNIYKVTPKLVNEVKMCLTQPKSYFSYNKVTNIYDLLDLWLKLKTVHFEP